MGTLQGPTTAELLAAELEHPNAGSIWNRALEVFGDEAKARSWMNAPRDIFEGKSPQELVATGADTVGTACPFCNTMFRDALAATDKPAPQLLDIAQLIARGLPQKGA